MTQIGAVCGEFWRIGSEMLGSRRGQLGMCDLAGNIQAQVLPLGTELDFCQLGRPYSINIPKVRLFQAFVDSLWHYPLLSGTTPLASLSVTGGRPLCRPSDAEKHSPHTPHSKD
jgi:hypothetical protein